MTTQILMRKGKKGAITTFFDITCCEFLKKGEYSSVYDEIYLSYPTSYKITGGGKEIINVFNSLIPYFTISIEETTEWIEKNENKVSEPWKKFRKNLGSVVITIKLNTKEYPGFKNLLIPTTLSRFALSDGEVSTTNKVVHDLVEFFNASKVEVNLPALIQTLDTYHVYYKTSAMTFGTGRTKILESAYQNVGCNIGRVDSFMNDVSKQNTWFNRHSYTKAFMQYVLTPFNQKIVSLNTVIKNGKKYADPAEVDAVELYTYLKLLQDKTEVRLRKYHDALTDDKSVNLKSHISLMLDEN